MNLDRKKVFDKFCGRCAYCGKQLTKSFQVDHVVPKMTYSQWERSGKKKEYFPDFLMHLTGNELDHIDNLFPSCRQCNFYKGTKNLEDFRYELTQLTGRLKKGVFIYKLALEYGLIQETDKEKKIVFYFETQIVPIHGKNSAQLSIGEIG